LEKAMYPVLKKYLEDEGFIVKAEVNNIDIVAKKGDLVLGIEMKTVFSTKLIYQGIKRTHILDYVYLAIPKPTSKILKSKNFKEKRTIARRLELGLLLVDLSSNEVDVILDPKTYHFKKNKKKKRKLLKEFNLRKTSVNVGGVTKTKIITAYRELALLALSELYIEPRTTKYLREYTGRKKIVNILQKNYYGWFERVERGTYQITQSGMDAFLKYHGIIEDIKTAHLELQQTKKDVKQ
jgi:hypothetical protein